MSFICSYTFPCCKPSPQMSISITNSCNSKCKLFRPSQSTRVYINSRGEAEVFDPRKAADEREAMKRSLSNLHTRVNNLIIDNNMWERAKEIRGRVGVIVPHDSPSFTVKMLDNVNTILRNAFTQNPSNNP